MSSMNGWLRRLQHDLVKRMVWPARDRRDLGGAPRPGELVARLTDDEGRPIAAQDLWIALRAEAPADAPAAALDAFGEAVARAAAAAPAGDLDGVLHLEAAFRRLGAAFAGES
jgi:hypothetical protein